MASTYDFPNHVRGDTFNGLTFVVARDQRDVIAFAVQVAPLRQKLDESGKPKELEQKVDES